MKATCLCMLSTCLFVGSARSQTAVDSIKATIEKMFLAMKTGDTVLLKQCFADSAIMQTIVQE